METILWKISMDNSMEKRGSIGKISGPQECRGSSAIHMVRLWCSSDRRIAAKRSKANTTRSRNTHRWNETFSDLMK